MENYKKNIRFFVLLTYIGFYIALGLCGLVIVFGVSMESIQQFAPIVISWVSFAVVMTWANKLLSGISRTDYIKDLFREKISIRWIVISIVIPSVIFVIVTILLSIFCHKPAGELINKDYASYPFIFLLNLLAGPLGEELGWRGYFYTRVSEKNGILKGSLITGLVWGLWHAPLWVMNGFTPGRLIIYAISFMGAFIGFNIIIGYIFSNKRNLVYAIIVHQLFNFLTKLINMDADILICLMVLFAVFYLATAVIMILINKNKKEYRINA